MLNEFNIVTQDPPSEEDQYIHPNMSEWIVVVDENGRLSILKAPNIHPSFFERGREPEDVGLPYEVVNTPAGVYKWICSYKTSTDWETGLVDDVWFEPVKEEVLYLA